ncbi:hypothetical protein PYW08_012260 [Mythimna loreyi]|uniref:Uncharacterized protein n=1 Tax=Mythimna loreyi TaxID=667449 RepID=A0ACC2Q241_9NEOP|nr:hypothetical protein PYW08_012260 [Mythimna loreyi]
MASSRDEGPVYYREIQKNAYLKRIPNDVGGSKLRPLGSKKVPLKPMWTQLCVHNGRTPYLEQYPEASSPATVTHKPIWRACLRAARHVTASVKPHAGDQYDFLVDTDSGAVRMLAPDCMQMITQGSRYLEQYPEASSPATVTHKPIWRACLRAARHVTASVKPHAGDQYDFLVDTDSGAVRMLAPDWESMQDWVSTLRNTLHELKILGRGENVYCMGPAPPPPPPPPRAAARDPMSPLPPTPPTPPDRVPGIELTTTRPANPSSQEPTRPEARPEPPRSEPEVEPTTSAEEDIDISNWDTPFTSLPSTSQAKTEPRKSVAKICGQNICLDDSIFKRTSTTDSDEEFFSEIDRICDEEIEAEYKQRVVVSNGDKDGIPESLSNHQATNITVIQVSNKEPPHTAIPVMGPETDVFDFEFKQKLTITDQPNPNFVNIVNTEEKYGTTFTKSDSDYGHLSLTTTVSLSGTNDEFSNFSNTNNFATANQNEELYERLCMASTSNSKPSPLPVKKLKNVDKSRKSSLPNLEVGDSTYEYLFPSNNNSNSSNNTSVSITPEVNCNGDANRVQVSNSGSNNDPLNRLRSIERSRSQNAYDAAVRARESVARRAQNNSPKREVKNETTEQNHSQNKPIWKRGLTELSLLTRLKSIGQAKKESPTRQDDNQDSRSPGVTSPIKVVHRSRPEVRVDSARRRSSSLSNDTSLYTPAPAAILAPGALTPLRARQASALRAEQRRGAALPATVNTTHAPIFTDYHNQVWIAWWGPSGVRMNGRTGDRVAALCSRAPRDAAHARQLLNTAHKHTVDILFHRVPLGKIYVVNKRDQEALGLKLDSECNITGVAPHSACARAGLPPPGSWALTEINNRPINLLKGGEDDMNRLSKHGTEVSILIQPSAFVKKLRSSLKGNKTLLGLR